MAHPPALQRWEVLAPPRHRQPVRSRRQSPATDYRDHRSRHPVRGRRIHHSNPAALHASAIWEVRVGSDAGFWARSRSPTSPKVSGSHRRRCRRRGTVRWSPPSATPCASSAARTGPAIKEVPRRSRPWTSRDACDSPPSNPLAVQIITTSPALQFRSVLTLREYRCRAAWRG